MLIKGGVGVTLITRGFGQTVTLEPYLFAEVNTTDQYSIFVNDAARDICLLVTGP